MPFLTSLPETARIQDVYGMRPDRFANWTAFSSHIMRGGSANGLPLDTRQLISAYVSGLNACAYCYGAHRVIAIAFGFETELLEALMEDVATAPVDDRLKPLLVFLRKLTLEPAKVTPSDAEAVLSAGWNEEAFNDAVTVASLFAFVNRMAMGHGIEPLTEEQAAARAEEIYRMTYPEPAGA